ncbi:ATP-binding protein [Hymenobacter sp. CRA2]|uniref:ATP-binding protein n=1 Tax=Hymenobacter sp. CRA2 TaxID=1955620 RepID=UPI0020C9C71B|nr:SbcC/MukB-like Walker B domain-containing protein [Hymenobacter sp. CRA2]
MVPQGNVNTDFLVLPHALGIAELGTLDASGDWKRRLRAAYPSAGPVLFGSFREYADALRRALGMREKALTLFGKAVSLKVVGRLNDFIREHMLEPGTAEDDFQKLRAQYQQLLEAHRALEKATEQQRLLQSLPADEARLRQAENQLTELTQAKLAVRYLFTQRQKLALEQADDQKADELVTLERQLDQQTQQLEADRKRQRELDRAIQQDDNNRQLESLEKNIEQYANRAREQQARVDKYNQLAAQLHLPPCPADATAFTVQREVLSDQLQELIDAAAAAETTKKQLWNQQERLAERVTELRSEVNRLSRQPATNIPSRELDLRTTLCDKLGIAAAELPFVGELIRARDDAQEWQKALEGLLRGFALQLLVPEQHYAAVTAYVNRTNLRGLLVYQRLVDKPIDAVQQREPARSVNTKLDIRPDTPHRAWLEHQLRTRYPHVCVADEAELRQVDQALTQEGLIRNRHEHRKDDRPNRASAADFVLGWNSANKLTTYRQLLHEGEKELQEISQQLKQQDIGQKTRQATRDSLVLLSDFDSFNQLDVSSTEGELIRYQQEKQQLLTSEGAGQLRQLKEQLETLENHIKESDQRLQRTRENKGAVESQLNTVRSQLVLCEETLAESPVPADTALTAAAAYLPDLSSPTLSVDRLEKLCVTTENRVATEEGDTLRTIQGVEKTLLDTIRAFAQPSRELNARFPDWSGDVPAGRPDLDMLPHCLAYYRRLTQQELPQQREKFEKYLREETADGIVYFRQSLLSQVGAIEKYVAELNASLRHITFNHQPQPTYIKLVQHATPNQRVRDFKADLAQAIPDRQGIRHDGAAQQETFRRVQYLLERLHEQEEWRREVTDVRNWFVFQAQEFYRATDEPVPGKLYDGSGSLSGGQAAQLTYTVLGAALAYQFGLNRQQQGTAGGGRSFRLLVVDEAFSKLDPDKSRYLMELCRQLQLQVLVVTPDDKITVVEDFIAACHYIVCRDQKHSFVHNLSIEKYQELRKKFVKDQGELVAAVETIDSALVEDITAASSLQPLT